MKNTLIIEQCGARWHAEHTGAPGARAYWVCLDFGRSMAKPGIIGFYAASVDAAAALLTN